MQKRNYECHTSACKHVNSKRTIDQNSALHLYCSHVAEELNAAGWSIKKALELYKIDLDWNMYSVKDLIWRPVQKHFFQKESTADLRKQEEIDVVYEHVNRFLSNQPFSIHVPFPNNPNKHKEKQYLGAEPLKDYPEQYQEPKF